jgi:hypothetical protein
MSVNYKSIRGGCIVIGLITMSTIILYKIIKESDLNNASPFPLSEIMLHI